jgi:hypothetical protein
MEAARTSETSVDSYFTRQYIPEDNSELHTRRRENLKSHIYEYCWVRARYISATIMDNYHNLEISDIKVLRRIIFFVLSFILRVQPTWTFEFCDVLASR